MSKELPYFKFFPGKWITGDITICSLIAQGLFVNICSFYWMKKCSISQAKLVLRFTGYESEINELIHCNVLKVNGGNIVIDFLDEQMSEFINISSLRAEVGSKGGSKYAKWGEIERAKGEQLYVLLLSSNDEKFIKIGVTNASISRRYSKKIPYEIATLYQYFGKDDVYHEAQLHKLLSKYEYLPKFNYPGYRESYLIDCMDEIDQYFNKLGCKKLQKQSTSKTEANHRYKEEDKIREDKNNKGFFDSEKLNSAFNDFLEMRKKIKKPATKRAIELLIKKLNSFSTDENIQLKIIEQSTVNSWQDLYELKSINHITKPKHERFEVDFDGNKDGTFFPKAGVQ